MGGWVEGWNLLKDPALGTGGLIEEQGERALHLWGLKAIVFTCSLFCCGVRLGAVGVPQHDINT